MSIFFQALPTQKPEEPIFFSGYSVLSEYGPIEAVGRTSPRRSHWCIPCSQSTAPLKPTSRTHTDSEFGVFRALRVRPHRTLASKSTVILNLSIPCSQSTAPLKEGVSHV